MDGISAAASLIAILEAAAALPKVVKALQSFVKVKSQLAELINEVETLRATIQAISNAVNLYSSPDTPSRLSVPEPIPLKQSRRALVNIVGDLEQLVAECSNESTGPGVLQVRRVKWILRSNKIKRLLSQTKEIRQNIVVASQLMEFQINQNHGYMLMELLSVQGETIKATREVQRMVSLVTQSALPEKPSAPISCGNDSEHFNSAEGQDFTGAKYDPIQSLSNINLDEESRMLLEEPDLLQISASIPQLRRCGPACRCQCHHTAGRFESPRWLQPLLGSFFLNYNCLPVPQRWKCDLEECSGSQSTVRLHYYFPRWAWNRAISLSTSINSLTGEGASIHLSFPRIISYANSIWSFISWDHTTYIQEWYKADVLPSVRDEFGRSLLFVAITRRSFACLKFLYCVWGLGQVGAKCDTQSSLEARLLLEAKQTDDLNPDTKYILQKIVLLGESESQKPQLHSALNADYGLRDALQENPQTLNQTNIFGQTSLHAACQRGNIAAVSLLTKSRAFLNSKDFRGHTPLITAIWEGNYTSASRLVEAGCDVSIIDDYGNCALYYAMNSDITPSYNLIMSLLSRMCTSSLRGVNGDTVLHWICDVNGPEQLVQNVLEALLEAGADKDARNVVGRTPLLQAAGKNNTTIFRLLIESGARLDRDVGTAGYTLMHYVATYGDIELLQYLKEQAFDNIYTEPAGKDGCTPLRLWRWRTHTDERWLWPEVSRPTPDEHAAFEELLRTLRNRYLQKTIGILEDALRMARRRDAHQVTSALETLSFDENEKTKEQNLETIRVIGIQIQDGEWEDVEEVLQEMIDVRRERLEVSPLEEEPNPWTT